MNEEVYSDKNFEAIMQQLHHLAIDAKNKGFIEIYVILMATRAAALSGNLRALAKKCKDFSMIVKEELLKKRPKRKLNIEGE